jgi:hypothetical protein
MKTKVLILLAAFLMGCTDYSESHTVTVSETTILDKQVEIAPRNGQQYFKVYIYDGTKAYWCYTSRDFYYSVEINQKLISTTINTTQVYHE